MFNNRCKIQVELKFNTCLRRKLLSISQKYSDPSNILVNKKNEVYEKNSLIQDITNVLKLGKWI